MKYLGIVLLVCLSSKTALGIFGKSSAPAWDALRVTFGLRPEYLPRTVEEAKKDGWTLDKSCDYNANGFYGHRYMQNGDLGSILLFDDAGYIAGLQTAVGKNQSNGYPSGQVKKSFVEESDKFTVSAYFTDPAKICNGGRNKTEFEAQGTGDRLIIQDGGSLMTIPMEEKAVKAPWVHGKCFVGMGVHKWYNVTPDMKCSDTKPLFLLYNKGKLNAFGWALFADLPSSRFEHPPFSSFGRFMKSVPSCLKTGTISTMHVYMTSTPYLNFC